MLFFQVQPHPVAKNCIEVVSISDRVLHTEGWVSRHDFNSFEEAHEVAESASRYDGVEYLATDAGQHTYPRFDVIKAPQQFDKVSYTFNGDYYPCGVIKTISKTGKKITTSTGHTFYRKRKTGSWMMNDMWFMTSGWIEERNPHF